MCLLFEALKFYKNLYSKQFERWPNNKTKHLASKSRITPMRHRRASVMMSIYPARMIVCDGAPMLPR